MITKNNKAKDYEILETYESGIILQGHEVKAAVSGKFELTGAWIDIDKLMLIGSIVEADAPEWLKYNPQRDRSLLLNRTEIRKLKNNLNQGLSIIPINSYISNGKLKLKIALVKGLKNYDKREKLKKNQFKRGNYE